MARLRSLGVYLPRWAIEWGETICFLPCIFYQRLGGVFS